MRQGFHAEDQPEKSLANAFWRKTVSMFALPEIIQPTGQPEASLTNPLWGETIFMRDVRQVFLTADQPDVPQPHPHRRHASLPVLQKGLLERVLPEDPRTCSYWGKAF